VGNNPFPVRDFTPVVDAVENQFVSLQLLFNLFDFALFLSDCRGVNFRTGGGSFHFVHRSFQYSFCDMYCFCDTSSPYIFHFPMAISFLKFINPLPLLQFQLFSVPRPYSDHYGTFLAVESCVPPENISSLKGSKRIHAHNGRSRKTLERKTSLFQS
jgi:hypothetical protein